MSTVLRLCWFFCMAVRQPHALLATGVILVVLVGTTLLFFARSGAPPGPFIPFMSMLGITAVMMPALWSGGQMFRMLSGSRVVWFAPYARTRMLAALLMVVLATSLILAAPFQFAPLREMGEMAGTGAVVVIFLILSVFTWSAFLPPIALLVFPVLPFPGMLVMRWAASAVPAGPWSSGVAIVVAVLVIGVALWCVLGLWYLRVRRIRPMRFGDWSGQGWFTWWSAGRLPAGRSSDRLRLRCTSA